MSNEPYLGAIEWVAFDFAPQGWAFCNGQLLPINQNQALYSLIGTMYGGNGVTNFALPDLRGRTPIGTGQLHEGGPTYTPGQQVGAETHTLTLQELPTHGHPLGASDRRGTSADPGPGAPALAGGTRAFVDKDVAEGTMAATAVSAHGGGQPHENMQPYVTLNAIIALRGTFPSRQ